MSANPVDPIHYAWAKCNKGVPLPAAIRMKNTSGSPLASSLSSAWRIPTQAPVSPDEAEARAAIHSRILGGRREPRVKGIAPPASGSDHGTRQAHPEAVSDDAR